MRRDRNPAGTGAAAADADNAARWASRNLKGPAFAKVVAPEAVEGLHAVFAPDGGEARRRLARDMPSDSELVARWLETEPGATRLVAEQGRGCLIALARLRISAALTQGERARRRRASWETAQRVAEQMVQGLD